MCSPLGWQFPCVETMGQTSLDQGRLQRRDPDREVPGAWGLVLRGGGQRADIHQAGSGGGLRYTQVQPEHRCPSTYLLP